MATVIVLIFMFDNRSIYYNIKANTTINSAECNFAMLTIDKMKTTHMGMMSS